MSVVINSWKYYIESFQGLSKEIWWLSLVTFINRAGGMVVPFLSLYLTKDLGFTLAQVGWIMTCFGCGAFVGSWLGGQLTDRIGFYKVMIFSLVISGGLFLWLSTLQDLWWICGGVFLVTAAADAFRPAAYVAAGAYSSPQNYTRAITLIRLAINLGFSMGPAAGGFLIASLGYASLFWIDGATCVLAGIAILVLLKPKLAISRDKDEVGSPPKSIWSDHTYLIFLFGIFIFGLIFIQYFSVMPVYYHDAWDWSELHIGWLLSLNGVFIFLFEMPLIKYLDRDRFPIFKIMMVSSVLLAISFFVLEWTSWSGILVVGMLFATLAEMMCFPFSNTFALKRAGKGNEGKYMGYYTMAFSLAHIVGHNLGMNLTASIGYFWLMNLIGVLALLSGVMFWWVKRQQKKEADHI